MLLGILFEKQNIAFLVGLAFGVAASCNFPVLILSMYWKGLTTRGALWGGIAGLVSAVGLVVLSTAVWVTVLGNAQALFPYDHPAIFSMTLAFFVTWLVSVTDKSARAAKERKPSRISTCVPRPASGQRPLRHTDHSSGAACGSAPRPRLSFEGPPGSFFVPETGTGMAIRIKE